jgi:hypothetical protein
MTYRTMGGFMESISCPLRILAHHNEEHAKPGSTANQLVPGMENIQLTEGDCALEALKCASSDELHAVMDEADSCHDIGRCMLDKIAD